MYKVGNYTEEECAKNCKEFVPEAVPVVTVDVDKDEVPCMWTDDDDCTYQYVYYYDETNCLQVRAQSQRDCPHEVFFLGIVLGVIAAVVIVGLILLLMWKAAMTIHDRREFARFERERMMAKWDTVKINFSISISPLISCFLKNLLIENIQHFSHENKLKKSCPASR